MPLAHLFSAAAAAAPAPLARFAFDDTLEPAAGPLRAQAQGAAPQFAEGLRGRALRLGDGRFVSFGPAPELDIDEATIELLVQMTADPAQGYNPCVIAKREDREARWSLHVMQDRQALAIWNGAEVGVYETPDAQPLEIGRWYHVAVVLGRQATLVHLDGAPCDNVRGTAIQNVLKAGLPLYLGASSGGGNELFGGLLIDDLTIHAAALDPEQIATTVDALGWSERRQGLTRVSLAREAERRRLAAEREAARQGRIDALLANPALVEVGAPAVYEGERLSGIYFPVGGIGGGPIQINGAGELEVWQIFGNYENARLPESFFGLKLQRPGAAPVIRALQTAAVGPFSPMAGATFESRYPVGTFTFTDESLPAPVRVTYWSPLIPFVERDSAMPCLLAEVLVENPTDQPLEATVFATQLNAVGYQGHDAINGRDHTGFLANRNDLIALGDGLALQMTSERPGDEAGAGELTLAVGGADAVTTGLAAYDSLEALHAALAAGPLVNVPSAGPAAGGTSIAGALAATVTVPPGGSRTIDLTLTWRFPNVDHGVADQGWGHRGWQYANWWASSLDLAAEITERRTEMRQATEAYTSTLYDSNLPAYVIERLANQAAILRSMTCWWAADGYFGGWEGCSQTEGCCFGNCGHVWHYAQTHAVLFPGLARRMREQALGAQRDDGALFFRQTHTGIAADGILGEILETYREHRHSLDPDWLPGQWPHARRAMDYVIAAWDADEDGLFTGAQHNTLDADMSGASSWMGTLYLAALEAAARMAAAGGDDEAAGRYRRLRAAAAARQDAVLYNGEYYIQVPDAVPQRDYATGCHIDQLLGEWWADQLDIPWGYPLERKQSALRALLRHNFQPEMTGVEQSPRKFVADEDAGLQMITWPNGGKPAQAMLYASECMTGFEYAAAAAMLQHGLEREGLLVVKAIADRYDGRRRTGLTGGGYASWGYSGNPYGDDECGKFYARAMSNWSLLTAMQGFAYDASTATLRCTPRWRPDDHRSMFAAAECYGTLAAGPNRLEMAVRAGRLTLARLVMAGRVEVVEVAGRRLECEITVADGRCTAEFARPVTLGVGESLVARR